jgi:hypothetical protein
LGGLAGLWSLLGAGDRSGLRAQAGLSPSEIDRKDIQAVIKRAEISARCQCRIQPERGDSPEAQRLLGRSNRPRPGGYLAQLGEGGFYFLSRDRQRFYFCQVEGLLAVDKGTGSYQDASGTWRAF